MPSRLLLVEDNTTVRKIIRTVLEEAGFAVTDAVDGQAALEIVQRDMFEIALIDFVMPKLNGYQLALAIRSIAHLRTLPIVLMSAKAEQIGERFMRQTGAVDAITKPFSPDAILAVLSHALDKKNGASAPHTLVREELHSHASLIPSAPTSDTPGAEPTATDMQPLHTKPTMPDLAGVMPLVLAQVNATHRFAELAAASLFPAVRAMMVEGGEMDEKRFTDALVRTVMPAELAALAREVRSFDDELRGPVVLEGVIEKVALGEVLQILRLQRQKGILVVRHKQSEVVVAFDDGNVDLALARGVSPEFLLGRYLLADGLLRREELDRALAESPRGGWLGERLMTRGALRREDLERALTRQTSEIVYEMLRWEVGRYRFEFGVALPEAQSAHLGLPIESMVLEGFRRVDEWRVIEQEVASFDDVLARDEAVIEAVGGRMASEEQIVLEAVDGKRSVRDVIGAAAMSSFDGCRILYRLLRSRLVRRRAA